MGQLKQLPDVLTKNSASRKSAVTMRGSTVRRTKIDDPTLHLQSITRRVGLPAGIRKRARSIFRHLLTIKSTSCCQNCAAYNYSILHLKTNTDVYQFFLFGWVVKCKKCAKHFYLRHSRRYRDLQCFVKHVSKIYCK